MVLKNIQHLSPYGPAVQVDTTVRSAFVASCDGLLIQFVDIGAGFPARPGPYCAQCSVTSGIMLARNLEAVDRVAQCRRGCCDDAGRKYVGYEARLRHSGSLRGAPLHLRPVVGILQSFHVRHHHSLTSDIHHSYSVTYISPWMLLG